MNRQQFIDYKGRYISALPSMKKSVFTARHYKMVLDKFADYLNSDSDITPLTIVNWRVALFNSGISNNTVKDYLIVLHTFFAWAIRMKLTEENPVSLNEIPKEQQREYNLLTLEEINAILSAPKKKGKMACRNRAIVVLLIQSGLRSGELRSLRLRDLDFKNSTISVEHGKGDKKRLTPFPALSQQLIREYLKSGIRPLNLTDNDYLFGTDASETGLHSHTGVWKSFSTTALLGIVKRYTEKACGHKIIVHNLRHAFASLMAENEVPMRDVQLALGHSSVGTTEKIYTTVLNKRKSAESINDVFNNLNFGDTAK